MDKYRSSMWIALLSLALLLVLSGCSPEPLETQVVVVPAATPTPEVVFVLPSPTLDPFLPFPATPPVIVIVEEPTPTQHVVVVTATSPIVILPETGADLAVQRPSSNLLAPLGLIVVGVSLVVVGYLFRRR